MKELFPGLQEELYNEIITHATIREIKAGETLLRAGQTIRSAIIILEGIVKLYREDEAGREFFIYYINPGEACSLSLVCATKHETSEVLARALTDTVVLTIPIDFIEEWMSKYKSWYKFVITSYRNRFEELLKTIDAIAFSNMDERLEFYLKNPVEKLGPNIKAAHQEIANDLNSSREVISRLLKKMELKKRIVIHRNSIEWIKEEKGRQYPSYSYLFQHQNITITRYFSAHCAKKFLAGESDNCHEPRPRKASILHKKLQS